MDKFGSIVVIRTDYDLDDFWKLIPNTNSEYWPVVSVDFNGVLDVYGGWTWFKPILHEYKYHNSPTFIHHEPAPNVHDFLDSLYEMYNTIVLSTATRPLDYAVEWLLYHRLDHYIDFATNFKIPCEVHIDDNTIHHCGNFTATIEKVTRIRNAHEI